jgi:hypothetical protein
VQSFNIELTSPNQEQQIVEASKNFLSSNEAINEIDFSNGIKFFLRIHLFRVITLTFNQYFFESNT